MNIIYTHSSNLIFPLISVWHENLLDVDTTAVPSNNAETRNTFGSNLLRRLGVSHGHTEAETASIPPSSDNTSAINPKSHGLIAL